MSSHHIIRENQEPALVVENFEAIDADMLGQLLEWSPTIITSFFGYYQAVELNIKVDYVVLIEAEVALQKEVLDNLPDAGTQIFTGSGCFFNNVFQLLNQLKNSQVNIVTIKKDPSCFLEWTETINPVVFWDQKRYTYVESGFSKWKVGGSLIHVFGASLPLNFIHEGLIQKEDFKFECTQDGIFQVYFSDPKFIILGENYL